jgi:hypothetical protein
MSDLSYNRRTSPAKRVALQPRLSRIVSDRDGVLSFTCTCRITVGRMTTDPQVAQAWKDHHRCTGIGYSTFGGLPQ